MRNGRPQRRHILLAERDEEPPDGVANLFDAALAFFVALLAAVAVGVARMPQLTATAAPIAADDSAEQLELQPANPRNLPRLRESQQHLSGRGQRLGMSYRLKSGEVAYVPHD